MNESERFLLLLIILIVVAFLVFFILRRNTSSSSNNNSDTSQDPECFFDGDCGCSSVCENQRCVSIVTPPEPPLECERDGAMSNFFADQFFPDGSITEIGDVQVGQFFNTIHTFDDAAQRHGGVYLLNVYQPGEYTFRADGVSRDDLIHYDGLKIINYEDYAAYPNGHEVYMANKMTNQVRDVDARCLSTIITDVAVGPGPAWKDPDEIHSGSGEIGQGIKTRMSALCDFVEISNDNVQIDLTDPANADYQVSIPTTPGVTNYAVSITLNTTVENARASGNPPPVTGVELYYGGIFTIQNPIIKLPLVGTGARFLDSVESANIRIIGFNPTDVDDVHDGCVGYLSF